MKRLLSFLLFALLALPVGSLGQSGIWVNDDGVLREITGVWVNDDGVLREIQSGWVNDDGTLRQIFSALAVSPNASAISNVRAGAICYAGIEFNTDGTENENTNVNVFSISRGDWLDAGANSDVWIERTINSGPGFNVNDPGAGRLIMTSVRVFNLSQTSEGTKITNVTFDFWDAAAGGTKIGTVTFDVTATWTS